LCAIVCDCVRLCEIVCGCVRWCVRLCQIVGVVKIVVTHLGAGLSASLFV